MLTIRRQSDVHEKLFYPNLSLKKRTGKEPIPGKIAKHTEFDFIYKREEGKYVSNGTVSFPAAVFVKMLLLLLLYTRSDREPMQPIGCPRSRSTPMESVQN